MSDKDEIKELFNRELNNYSVKVDPSVWNGISQSLGSSVAANTVVTKLSLFTKVLIISSAAAIVGVSAFLLTNTEEEVSEEKNELSEEKVEEIVIIDDKKSVLELTLNDESQLIQEEKSNRKTDDNQEKNLIESGDLIEKEEKIIESKNSTESKHTNKTVSTTTLADSSSIVEDKPSKVAEEKSVTQKRNEEETKTTEPLFVNLHVERKSNQHYVFEIEANEQSETYLDFGDGKVIRGKVVEYVFDEPGSYVIQAVSFNDSEEVIDEVVIEVKTEGKFTNLPNVFSPNGDGVSDEFFIQHEGIEDFQLTIFNQKSEVVFETNEIDFKWGGLDRRTQQQVPTGNYYYIIIAQDKAGNVINKHQTLSIFRN